jgi:MFS family permease
MAGHNPSIRAAIGTLILATSIVQLAIGFFGTFLSLRVVIEGFDATRAGLVLSSYFAGFTLGALRSGPIIERIGHIRAYAAFAGAVIAATVLMPLAVDAVAWTLQRAVVGFGCAGLFTTTESWLNAKASADQRGRVFSIYMVGVFAALGIGQLLIGRVEVESSGPFNAIALLLAIALVMVSTTRAEGPRTVAYASLPFGQLARAAPVAVVGCIASGLVGGAFYALVPAWMEQEGIARETIALFMFAAVLGGLAFQVPVGRLSDRVDRRLVLAGLAAGLAATATVLVLLPATLAAVLLPAVLLGGFLSTLYPVCASHAHDAMPADRVVAVSGRLILVSGLGSVLGPLIGTRLMVSFDIDGVLYFISTVAVLLAVMAAIEGLRRPAPERQERTFDVLAPQASTLAHDPGNVDSRTDAAGTAGR